MRGESSNSMEQPEELTQVTREELKSEAPTLYNYSQVSKEEILKRALKQVQHLCICRLSPSVPFSSTFVCSYPGTLKGNTAAG